MKRSIAVILALGAVSLAGCGGLGKGKLAAPVQHTTVTADGWALSLLHYQPASDPGPRLPVILCHGLSYNATFWDLADEVSLAKFLQQAGYDVWVPSLRGAGWSTKPPLSRLRQLFRGDLRTAGGVFTSAGRGALKLNWNVDDHVRGDIPAILNFVAEKTGRKKAFWVGHSMGGMVLVAHLAGRADEDRLAGFVALGVPVFIIPPLSEPLKMMAESRGAFELSNVVVSTNLPAVLGAIGGGKLASPIDVLFYNPANVSPDVVRRLNIAGTDDISPGQLAQLVDMVSTGSFRSADGKTDHTAALGRMTVPALFCAGTVDNLATVGAVKKLYHQWGAKEKSFRLFGVVNAQRSDYGHDDLVIGRRARLEVYPVIRRWLDDRCGIKPRLELPLPLAGVKLK